MIAIIPGTLLGLCVYALVRARSSLAEALRVLAITADIPPTTVRDAPRAGRVHLTGRASGAGGAVVRAPFTDEEVLWARAAVRTNIGQVIDEWRTAVDTLVLEDGAGGVANVALSGATVRAPDSSVTGADNDVHIAVFMNSIGRAPGSGEFHSQSVLRPGDTVSVVGTTKGDAGYRASANTIHLSAEAGELLVFHTDAESETPERCRRNITAAIVGIVIFGLLTVGCVVYELG